MIGLLQRILLLKRIVQVSGILQKEVKLVWLKKILLKVSLTKNLSIDIMK